MPVSSSSNNKIEIATHQNVNSHGSNAISEESQAQKQVSDTYSDNESVFELGYKEGKESVFNRFCEIIKVPVTNIFKV